MIGCAHLVCLAFLHYAEWNAASRLVAVGVGIISCMLDFLAGGHAIKQWQVSDDDLTEDALGGRAQFLGSMIAIIQIVTQIFYVGVIFKRRTVST